MRDVTLRSPGTPTPPRHLGAVIARRLLQLAMAGLVVVALGACGGGDGTLDTASILPGPDRDVPTPTAPAPATPDPTPTATEIATAAPEPSTTPEAESTSAATESAAPTDVYDAPGSLELPLPVVAEGEPGTVIDTEELGIDWGVGQRLLYRSTAADGDPIGVSGFVTYPAGDPPAGGWPLIAWAHGTTGLGDECAPSLLAEEDQVAQALAAFGFAVVATDYEGLGTPGVHPYIVGRSEAHSVLDSVRAVHELGLPVSDEWVVFGHSQGGHAALFTGQLQPTYAPELDLIGVVAGAPPSQLDELHTSLIDSEFRGYLIMIAAGLAAADDTLQLPEILSPDALAVLDAVESGCTDDIFAATSSLDFDTALGDSDPFELPNWGDALRANETNLQPVPVPLLIIHGGADEQIPVDTSAALVAQLCAFEEQGPTTRLVYEGQSHAGVLTNFVAVPDLLTWATDRFAGAPAPDDCPKGP